MSRRQALLGGLTLAAAAACATKPVLAKPAEPVPPSHAHIEALQRQHNAKVGVYALNLDSRRSISYLDGETFAMCSTFKTYAAARVLQMVERGELTSDYKLFVDRTAVVAHSPVTGPRAGGDMTVAELCQAALQISDNTAGNLLLKTIGGPPAITAFARSIGDEKSRLDRWETELNSAVPGDPRDTTTPYALGAGYRNLLVGDVLAPPQRQLLEEWMRANQTSSMRAGLPPGWTTADKTGTGDYGSTNDVGMAYGPAGQRVLLAIMTRSVADDPKVQNLRPLIGELAAALVAELLA
jgi:beta-lactamase class A